MWFYNMMFPTLISEAVNILPRNITRLSAVYSACTGEKLWAQLWWLPAESMSRSVLLCRWHQHGQLPSSCYRCRSLGNYSEEHHSRLHNQSANANTQYDIYSREVHRCVPLSERRLLDWFPVGAFLGVVCMSFLFSFPTGATELRVPSTRNVNFWPRITFRCECEHVFASINQPLRVYCAFLSDNSMSRFRPSATLHQKDSHKP